MVDMLLLYKFYENDEHGCSGWVMTPISDTITSTTTEHYGLLMIFIYLDCSVHKSITIWIGRYQWYPYSGGFQTWREYSRPWVKVE